MTRIAIVIASTRQNRRGKPIGDWVHSHATSKAPEGIAFDLVDLADFNLPVLDESAPAAFGMYEHEHTKKWARAIEAYDGYVFITPEYNRGVPGALKNAIDYLYGEWANKSVGFVGYGVNGGVRAVEQLRTIAGELQLADVSMQVCLNTFTDFDYDGLDVTDPATTGRFNPDERHLADLSATLHQVVTWAEAMASIRAAGLIRA